MVPGPKNHVRSSGTVTGSLSSPVRLNRPGIGVGCPGGGGGTAGCPVEFGGTGISSGISRIVISALPNPITRLSASRVRFTTLKLFTWMLPGGNGVWAGSLPPAPLPVLSNRSGGYGGDLFGGGGGWGATGVFAGGGPAATTKPAPRAARRP